MQKLEAERKRQALKDLIIVAAPRFLGDLRTAMSAQLESCVTLEINKDLSKLKAIDIFEHIKDSLPR